MKKIQFKRLNNIVSEYVEEGITSYGNMDINGETARRLGFKLNKDSRNTYYIAVNNTIILSSCYSGRTYKTSIKQLKKAYTNISYRRDLINML